jgi:predicted NAD/FAD-binding protein
MSRAAVPTAAVIGSGVAGLTAAYRLEGSHRVTLYEAEDRLGGHAHTHQVSDPSGARIAVDTGFIVHNDRTYPLLRRLFGELGVATRRTEMSMSIRDEASGLEYAGGRGLPGIFAQRRRAVDPRFLSLLTQVRRFHSHARSFLRRTDDTDQTTFGEFLARAGFTPQFIRLYAVPLVSCVWSTGDTTALLYPARYLFRFLSHHGMLAVGGSPRWYTVVGGSRSYVDAIAVRLTVVRAGHRVTTVLREPDHVSVQDATGGRSRFDKVVIATHADQALQLLGDPGPQEKEVLGAFRYSRNEAVLHTDARLLPRIRCARASWNYLVPVSGDGEQPPVVSYWMNRLQGLHGARHYLVSLNAGRRIDPATVLAVMDYEHPVYDLPAIRAQARLRSLDTDRTVYAGAYHGWGFHEDGCRSGVEAARRLGAGR